VNRTDELKASIAARQEDLAELNSRNTSSMNADAKRAHRLNLMDANCDIEDLQKELQQAHAAEMSLFAVGRRAQGRAKRDEAIRLSAKQQVTYSEISALLKQLTEKAASLNVDSLASLASKVVEMDPNSTNPLNRREEASDIAEMSYGRRYEMASAIAGAIREFLSAFPCGATVMRSYLVPEPMSSWGGVSIEQAAQSMHESLKGHLIGKLGEPEQGKEAA